MAVALKKVALGWGSGGFRYVLDADKLEPGDKVAVVTTPNYGVPTVAVYTVARLTATQVVCTVCSGGEIRYRRADGYAVGASSRSVLHAVFDPAVLDAMQGIRMQVFARKLEAVQKGRRRDHEARWELAGTIANLAIQVQKDLNEIKSAEKEWEAACAAA